LFRYVIDYSVIELLESGLNKSYFITTENNNIKLRPDTAKKLIDKTKGNFSHSYPFRSKQYALDNITYENIKELAKYITDKKKKPGFQYS
jgi:thymidylate synthase ThyX